MTIFLICWAALILFVFLVAFYDAWKSDKPITFKNILKMLWAGVWFPPLYIYYEWLEYQQNKRSRERMKKIRRSE